MAAAVVLLCLGIVLAFVDGFETWVYLAVWLGFVFCLAVSGIFILRAVLIKRVGILHTTKHDVLYVVKNVIN
jgi:hypothetical protein